MDESFHIQDLDNELQIVLEKSDSFLTRLSTTEPKLQKRVFNNVLDSFFSLINLSILAGEYVENHLLVKTTIDNIKMNLSALLTAAEHTLTDDVLLKLSFSSVKIIENSLNAYELLIHRVSQITHPNLESSFIYQDDNLYEIANQSTALMNHHNAIEYDDFDRNKTLKAYTILFTNIHIALLDFSLKPNEEGFHRLELIEHSLTDLYSDPQLKSFEFIFLILQKAKFLKLKILIRFCQTQKEFGIELNIFQNSTVKTLKSLIEEIEFNELKEFLKYSVAHYIDTEENEVLVSKQFKTMLESEDTYFKRHLGIKYFKDIKRNKTELTKIVELFENELHIPADGFDEYANNVSLNYANNNLFSYQLEHDKDISYEEVLECYKTVQKVRNATKINNYFPELRFLKYLLDELGNLLDNNITSEQIGTINTYLIKCKELIKLYKKNINWTKYNHSYIFQLPFAECLVRNDSVEKAKLRHLFVASTMILPLNMDKNYQEQEEYANQIKVYDSIRNTIYNLKIQSQKLDQEIELNEKKDVKFIEILGLFCAISTFVSAAILSFMGTQLDKKVSENQNVTSTGSNEISAFLLSTGTILFAFMALLIFVFNRKSVNSKLVYVVILILIFLVATCNNVHH